jgi:hypothetical protein
VILLIQGNTGGSLLVRRALDDAGCRAEAMSPFDIIRSATTVNAELLNRSGELGVVAPGSRADLIAVDGDPLAYISLLDGQGEHLTHIMKDGVFTNGPCKASSADHPPETAYPSKSAGRRPVGCERAGNLYSVEVVSQ